MSWGEEAYFRCLDFLSKKNKKERKDEEEPSMQRK
jgi:hypothetical protein